jgi:hypothetical protein
MSIYRIEYHKNGFVVDQVPHRDIVLDYWWEEGVVGQQQELRALNDVAWRLLPASPPTHQNISSRNNIRGTIKIMVN